MATFEISRKVRAGPHEAWKIISDPDNQADPALGITHLEKLSENTYRLHHKNGTTWDERCADWHENQHLILEFIGGRHPLPVKKIERTLGMRQDGANIVLRLSYEYTPKYGIFAGLIDRYRITPALKTHSNHLLDSLSTKIHNTKRSYRFTAASIIKQKEAGLITVTPEMTVADANKTRADNKIGFLMVLDENKKLAGVLSERDIVNAISQHGYPVMEKPVADIMTRYIITCGMDDELQTLMALMTRHRIRHLPVVDNDKLLGIISIGDAVKARMDELEKESEAMHNYIKDRRWREISLQIGRGGASDEYDKLEDIIKEAPE